MQGSPGNSVTGARGIPPQALAMGIHGQALVAAGDARHREEEHPGRLCHHARSQCCMTLLSISFFSTVLSCVFTRYISNLRKHRNSTWPDQPSLQAKQSTGNSGVHSGGGSRPLASGGLVLLGFSRFPGRTRQQCIVGFVVVSPVAFNSARRRLDAAAPRTSQGS